MLPFGFSSESQPHFNTSSFTLTPYIMTGNGAFICELFWSPGDGRDSQQLWRTVQLDGLKYCTVSGLPLGLPLRRQQLQPAHDPRPKKEYYIWSSGWNGANGPLLRWKMHYMVTYLTFSWLLTLWFYRQMHHKWQWGCVFPGGGGEECQESG